MAVMRPTPNFPWKRRCSTATAQVAGTPTALSRLVSMPDDGAERLYLIYLREPEEALRTGEFPGMRRLGDELFLMRSALSRSKVYHSIKWATRPEALLVAPLEDDPKFKGMDAGALKWLRAGD